MKKLTFGFLFLCSVTSFAQDAKDYAFIYDTDSIINKGIRLHDQQKYDLAIAEYERISHADPNYLWAQYEKAMTLSATDKKAELRTLFNKLHETGEMKLYPNIYMLYGSFLSNSEEYEASEKIFNEGLPYMKNSSPYLYNMAILHIRKKEIQKAIDLLKHVVTINPNYASAHYFLGLTALESGKIVEGTLAMMAYLAISPTGQNASNAVSRLNSNYTQNYLSKSEYVLSEKGDDFSELEIILRNGLPLKSAYKVHSEFDDFITRQVQAVVDYSLEHKIGDGFFETTYMPWVADMARRKVFEPYSYYMLLSLEETLGKKLTKHKKETTSFYENYVMKDFWGVFAARKMEHYGQMQDVLISIDKSRPSSIGPNGTKKQGKYKLLNEQGNVSGELVFENDMVHGNQRYFNMYGTLVKEVDYERGDVHGMEKTYYSNGKPLSVYEYKSGKLSGPGMSYYPNGGKQCASSFANDHRDGMQICYYPNGAKKSELNYSNGKANGSYLQYNEAGDLTGKYDYKDDQLHGDYLEYYDGRVLRTEAKYEFGKPVGTIKSYFPNSVLSTESFYTNGKIVRYVDYNPNGKMSYEIKYDANEMVDVQRNYDWEGNLFYEEKFKSGDVKSGIQYTRNKPAGTPVSISKNPYIITNYEGNVMVQGNFEKGKKHGEWKYFYSNGVLRRKDYYVNGAESGPVYLYNRNGKLTLVYHQTDGKRNGLCENYDNGVLSQKSYYKDGERNGPYTAFRADGSVWHDGFLREDALTKQTTYWGDGKAMIENTYIDGDITQATFIGVNGKKSVFDYSKNGLQQVETYSEFNQLSHEITNGARNGKYLVHENKKLVVEGQFVNNKETGTQKHYTGTGKLRSVVPYYNGLRHGESTRYDLNGLLRLTDEFVFGDEYGMTRRYYNNKVKMCEYNALDGLAEGDFVYYNMAGEHILTLVFQEGFLKQYITLDASGKVSDKHEVQDYSAAIRSNYPDGKTAIAMTYVKGSLQGELAIYGRDGKPQYSAQYDGDFYNGERKEYYISGQLYKLERFTNGDYNGKQEYFAPNGKPILVANYRHSDLHGDYLEYEKGILTTTRIYDTDELVSIKK